MSRRESGHSKCRTRKRAILGRGAQRTSEFPVVCKTVPKAVALVVPRTSRAAEARVVHVSNVIYQNVYLIR